MKKLTIIILFAVSINCQSQGIKIISTSSKVVPCPIDTVRGTLYWHSKDEFNLGNSWDTGYWVGPCTPSAILGQHTFIPGKIKYTQVYQDEGSAQWKKLERVIARGQFYDSRWNKIKAEDVYALVVDRTQSPSVLGQTAIQAKAF